MKIKKKLTRKQFLSQEDEFIVFIRNALSWIKENSNLIIFGIIGVGIAVAAILGIRYKQKADIRNSAKLLFEARQNFNSTVEGEPASSDPMQSARTFKNKEEKYTAAIEAFDQTIKVYPSDPVAEDALFLKAESYYHLEKYDEAISAYNQYLDKYGSNGAYSVQALASLGYIYEDKEDYQKATEYFARIINDYPNYLLSDSIIMELGRCYEHVNEMEKAKEAYQKVVMNFFDSPMSEEARQKLDAMGLPASATDNKSSSE